MGHLEDSKKRFLDNKGYSEAFKKALKTNDLSKVKQSFKAAGLKTNRFGTSQKIKEKDFLKDLKLATKAGIIKDSEMAKDRFRREQIKENRDLTFKEKRSFNILGSNTKKKLIWEGEKKDLSFGAKIAAEEQKVRDQDMRKAGDVGIEGFETMEKEGDSTLWNRYKALNALRYKNEAARDKLKEISSEINMIRLRAKRDPSVLRNYGIPEITKDQNKGAWKPKTLPGREGSRAQKDEDKEEDKEKDNSKDKTSDKDTTKSKPSSSQGSISISHSAGGSAPAGIPATNKREIPVVPFSIVKGSRNFTKEVKPMSEINTENVMPQEKNMGEIEDKGAEEEQQYGFLDQERGDVKLD